MKKNIGNADRIFRIFFSIVIASIGYYYTTWWGLLAFIPLATSYFGFCPLYKILGINSCIKNEC